ncbi:hypothetical protein GGI35DRAFT_375770 [Trichoderma velutinum]
MKWLNMWILSSILSRKCTPICFILLSSSAYSCLCHTIQLYVAVPLDDAEAKPWHSNGPLCLAVQPLGIHPSADGASEPNCMQPPPCRICTLDHHAQRVRINYSDANRGLSVRFGVPFNIWFVCLFVGFPTINFRRGLDAYKSLYIAAAQSECLASVSRTICYITSESAFITESQPSIRLRMCRPPRRFHHQCICRVALEMRLHCQVASHNDNTSSNGSQGHTWDPSAGCQAGLMQEWGAHYIASPLLVARMFARDTTSKAILFMKEAWNRFWNVTSPD